MNRIEYKKTKMLSAWLELHGLLHYHPPNEGKRTHSFAAQLKAMGWSAGMPDILIFDAPPDYCGCAVELKASEKDRPTPEQRTWLDALGARGWAVFAGTYEQAVPHIANLYEIALM